MSPDAYEIGRRAGSAVRNVAQGTLDRALSATEMLKKHKYRALALALVFAPVALEAGGAFSHEVNIEEEYQARLTEARREWIERHRDNMTFPEYLNREGIASPDRIEAIERILQQYDSPVRVRSGFSVVRSMIDVLENFSTGGFYYMQYGQHGREHVIFHPGAIEFDEKFEEFILSELAHVEQAEKGELHIGEYLVEWIRYFGRRDAMYSTLDNPEGKAHAPGGYEERVTRDYAMIRDDYRLWARTAMRDYLEGNHVNMFNTVQQSREANQRVPAFNESSLSYSDFCRFLVHLENASRSNNPYDTVAGAQFFLRLIENLPAFASEEIIRPDRTHTLRVTPSRELYEQFVAYLAPYTPPEVPPYEQERPNEEEHQTLVQYIQYVDAAQEFDMTILSTYRYAMILLVDEVALESALNNAHQGAYQALISRQEYDFENGTEPEQGEERKPGALERIEQGLPVFTFAMYQQFAERLTAYARTHPTERERNSGDPFLNMIYIFNNVCVYTPDCAPGSGIMQDANGEVIARISTDENGEHYRAFAKIFEDSRIINRSW